MQQEHTGAEEFCHHHCETLCVCSCFVLQHQAVGWGPGLRDEAEVGVPELGCGCWSIPGVAVLLCPCHMLAPLSSLGCSDLEQHPDSPFRLLPLSGDEAATATLGSLCQCFTTLTGKNFVLISNLTLFSDGLKPFPLVLSLHALLQSHSTPLGTESGSKIAPESSVFQVYQSQISQPVFVAVVLQPLEPFCTLDSLQ